MTYSYRKEKIKLLTNKISKRGFARDLKLKLLEEGSSDFNDCNYKDISEAFMNLYHSKYKTKYGELSSFEFPNESEFSKWWVGRRFPSKNHKEAVEFLFPGLLTKWFDRKNFSNRFQLHLASLDLFSLSNVCNCEKEISESLGLEQHCKICLNIAIKEAKDILECIHYDWRPTQTDRWNHVDLCISGPKARSGLNIIKNRFDEVTATFSEFHQTPEEDLREKIDYDLDLSETSFIGLAVPEKVFDIYQDGNPSSVCIFLFMLIGLNLKCAVKYKNDLILDFLTALNCASIILFERHYGFIGRDADSLESTVQSLFLDIKEYFVEIDQKPLEERLKALEQRSLKNPTPKTKLDKFNSRLNFKKYNIVDSDKSNQLSNLFIKLLGEAISGNDDDVFNFLKEQKEVINDASESDFTSKFFKSEYAKIYQAYEGLNKRYFKLMAITGLSRNEIKTELGNMIQGPFNRTFNPGGCDWEKPSPYT